MFTFRAMNTDIAVIAEGDDEPEIAARVASVFFRAEQRFSRFIADSELSRLNRTDEPMVVSDELFGALARARQYVEMTDGLFDPGIGGALVALGYDRSFAPGTLDRERRRPMPQSGRFLDIMLDAPTRTVLRPADLRIDLGGMLKGATADEAARWLPSSGAIDAGGDAVVRGRSTTDEHWLVEIEAPTDAARTIATIALKDQAVATSAPNRRFWHVGGTVAHHLIDPRTQAPAKSDLLQVTVTADRAELADVLAKTAFLLGSREGARFLEAHGGIGGVLVRKQGPPLFVGAVNVREVMHG